MVINHQVPASFEADSEGDFVMASSDSEQSEYVPQPRTNRNAKVVPSLVFSMNLHEKNSKLEHPSRDNAVAQPFSFDDDFADQSI